LEPFAVILPPGAGVRALAGASYNGGGVVEGLVVLVTWIALSALIIFALDWRAGRKRGRSPATDGRLSPERNVA